MTAEERRATFLWGMTLGRLPMLQLISYIDVYLGRGNWTQVIFRKVFITMWVGDVLEELTGPKGRESEWIWPKYIMCENVKELK